VCFDESTGKVDAAQYLCDLIKAVSYRIHTILTDHIQFTPRKLDIWDSTLIFDRVCEHNDIAHQPTKVTHPWIGQVERMNCTLKDATVRRYCYDTPRQRRRLLDDFLTANSFAEGLRPCTD
jgi:hypothetical protein